MKMIDLEWLLSQEKPATTLVFPKTCMGRILAPAT
jgi:hypothetical protein